MTDIVWTKITDKTPRGEHLLFFPAVKGTRNDHPPMWRVDRYPVVYPRKPTHWAALTTPTENPDQ